ncbi:MAG: hypothetical protein QMD65_01525 [Patescibacteria group bacterium]|nr:hypothetical protein [Patescibacteria group bacterium]
MHEEIIQQIKKLRAIRPDEQFVKNSRGLILAANGPAKIQIKVTWPIFAWSAVAAFCIILVISLSLPRIQNSKILSSSLDQAKIEQELNNLTINIQLEQITYNQTVSQTIASALNEISDTYIKHLNRGILESEQRTLNDLNPQTPDIDTMLNKVIF